MLLCCRWENRGSDRCVGADRGHGAAGHRVQCAERSASAGHWLLWTAAGVWRGFLHRELTWQNIYTHVSNFYMQQIQQQHVCLETLPVSPQNQTPGWLWYVCSVLRLEDLNSSFVAVSASPWSITPIYSFTQHSGINILIQYLNTKSTYSISDVFNHIFRPSLLSRDLRVEFQSRDDCWMSLCSGHSDLLSVH